MKAIRNFEELIAHLSDRKERRRVAVVCGTDESTREAVARAEAAGFIEATMVDDDDVDTPGVGGVLGAIVGGIGGIVLGGILGTALFDD